MNFLNKIKLKRILTLSIISLAIISCDDFLDVNEDFDNPTTAPNSQLLTSIQTGVAIMTDFDNYMGDNLATYTHQMTQREEADQYGATPSSARIAREWNNIYLTLTDLETLIQQGEDKGDKVYVGIAQLLKAYSMSIAVDLWGDVPFSEATKLESGILGPVFDNQEDIYAAVFALIDASKANINSEEGVLPNDNDLFYKGNLDKWIRFANTLKLKLYNQTRLSSNFDQSGFNQLVNENNFFTSSADDFQFNHTANQSPSDERNRLFLASYGGTQVSYYISPWFYEILKGWNPNIHTGNADPRIPYYWVNQLTAGELPPDQGNPNTGDPNADYWDSDTGFFSIRFGSVGPDRDHSVQNSATFPGIFATGGMYDDGSGPTIKITSGTGVAPHRILTFDEFLYIQAELIQEGLLAGDAKTKLREAMEASFAKVDEVVAGTGTTQTIPVLSGSQEVTTFIDNVINEYEAASNAKQLEIIMTQKWVATFGDSFDQYNDYRRTGYPVLANPEGASPEYQITNQNGFPLNDSQTILNNQFQLSFYWPQTELNSNRNAPDQKNPATYSIFWDN
ncbi:SusD/RagB family nutrient-binding outer membrane lipoprotein [Tenacibaculum sp.]|uniref:SusD/RagB family nutrient-binding outer membrane lipoprotein n=1 Tax=Tenacibaculum sp. TaxID=1906242 RepID=UPI003AA83087